MLKAFNLSQNLKLKELKLERENISVGCIKGFVYHTEGYFKQCIKAYFASVSALHS